MVQEPETAGGRLQRPLHGVVAAGGVSAHVLDGVPDSPVAGHERAGTAGDDVETGGAGVDASAVWVNEVGPGSLAVIVQAAVKGAIGKSSHPVRGAGI
jgi:hypothetical protein